ncbi:cinnamoyl-CoA reductase-like SNL6 [Macadamia integrifolia]|uniref:cinnamoyl-CoA reductase-like SNL6 n=1 Tax=Macadamia integrifolia TaxID=60698 RepID=UPI001C4F8E74|nr:cinnamoyl-CoA reductase-like SNL6 [Macadamia integrifolia]
MAPASSSSSFDEEYSISRTVCVMDASGPLGSSLVDRLLQQGYTVHAALQNHDYSQVFERLCVENSKNLKVFHTDPFDYQSIVDALKGCSGLFYNFEPPHDQPTFDEFMAEVEVRTAHNVLEACAQIDTIDKIVFTSSVTAVIWGEGRKSTRDFDERNWSDVNFCKKYKLWYALSKTVSEKMAWALAMDRGLSMVTVNAGLLLGLDLSIASPYQKGAPEMYEDGVFVTVDLKFLVDAHICVYEDVSSYGRYLCFNHIVNRPEDAIKLPQMSTPDSASPPRSSWDYTRTFEQRISNKKLNTLMVEFARSGSIME